MSETLAVNCNCGTSTIFLRSQDHGHLTLHNNGQVKPCPKPATVEYSMGFCSTVWTIGNCLCATTGMSTTLTVNRNSGISTSFCTVRTVSTCRCTTTGIPQTLSKICNCRISTGFCCTIGPWAHVVAQRPACQVTLSKICNCGTFTSNCTVCTMDLSLNNNGHVQDLQLLNVHGPSARSGP